MATVMDAWMREEKASVDLHRPTTGEYMPSNVRAGSVSAIR